MESLVLTFDIGTQSARGLIVSDKGEILAFKQLKYAEPYFSPNPEWAEQKPDFYFDNIVEISRYFTKEFPPLMEKVKAVTITTFRDSTLCLDKDNKPLTNLFVWLDKREAKTEDLPKLPFIKKTLFNLVGVKDMIKMQQKQSVCNWIMTNEKEIWKNTHKYVMLPTYLNYKFTGKLIDSVSNQIGHVPFDYKKNKWMDKNGLTRCLFDVESEKLCDLIDAGDTIGTITKEVSELTGIKEGLPLIATGSDKACETLGLSVISKDKAAVSFGTSATVQFTTKDYFEPQPFAPAYPAAIKGYFNPEYQIYRGFWMVSWFVNNFAHRDSLQAEKEGRSTEEVLNDHLKDIPCGCNGLLLQPYWSPGVTNPNAKGSIIGFNDTVNKYTLYRAILEGIMLELNKGLKIMSKRGKHEIKEVYAGGGGSVSNEICQMAADVLNLPVKRIQTHEACGIGSSMVAFVSLGVFKNYEEAINSMVRVKDTFMPNEENHKIYEYIFNNNYSKIYKKLLPIFKNIKGME